VGSICVLRHFFENGFGNSDGRKIIYSRSPWDISDNFLDIVIFEVNLNHGTEDGILSRDTA
jgi:hypothetical protein